MTEFTSEMVDSFRADFDQAMKALEDKYDITVRLGNITYWKERFTADITVNSGRDPELIAAAEFDSQVWKYEEYGLTKGMYKRIFTGVNGKRYAFVGFNKNAKKYPLDIFSLEDDKRYKISPKFIKEIGETYLAETIPGSI